jgi:hypothetical protein
MLFFNPGKRIPGIPFIGDKLDILMNGWRNITRSILTSPT